MKDPVIPKQPKKKKKSNWTKEQKHAYNKTYYEKNKERERLRGKIYGEENKEALKIKATARRNRLSPEERAERDAAKYKRDKERGLTDRQKAMRVVAEKKRIARMAPEVRQAVDEHKSEYGKEYYLRPGVKEHRAIVVAIYLATPGVKEKRSVQAAIHNAKPETKARVKTAEATRHLIPGKKVAERKRSNDLRSLPDAKRKISATAKIRSARTPVRNVTKAKFANNRAKKLGIEGTIQASDVQALRDQQENRCAKCNVHDSVLPLSVDHIVPLTLKHGGVNWPYNLQLLCMPHNLSKHSSIADYRKPEHIPQEYKDYLIELENRNS